MEAEKEKQYTCLRCDHGWNSRCPDHEDFKKWKPILCPACKSPYWNKEKRTSEKSVSEKSVSEKPLTPEEALS
jgi:DNA-directed RNA polymerase subunit RPC12/RpoP